MKVAFIDSTHPLLPQILKENGFEILELFDSSLEETKEKIKQAEVWVIRSRFRITKEIIDSNPQLKCIGRAGAGMENIDLKYAESKAIKCVHAPEGNRDAVGEHALGMLLCLFNNICRANTEVREGKWIREGNRGVELAGKTVGIIGFGNMGSAFAHRLKGFDVKVLAFDKYKTGFGNELVNESSLEEIFEKAEVLSLHIPLTDETQFIVNDNFIQNFKNDFYLINTARGKVVKTADLVKNLRSGKVKGACLDVLEYEEVSFEKLGSQENISREDKDALEYLLASGNVILTPHIGGWTFESNEKIGRFLAEKIVDTVK